MDRRDESGHALAPDRESRHQIERAEIVDGDFIMTAAEVQPVLRSLRKSGIHIVALHNHMVGEQPAYYFTHFWGKAPAKQLAEAIRAALDAQKAVTAGGGH